MKKDDTDKKLLSHDALKLVNTYLSEHPERQNFTLLVQQINVDMVLTADGQFHNGKVLTCTVVDPNDDDDDDDD